MLKAIGRFDEALLEVNRAQELDPLSLIINSGKGLLYFLARRYDQAIQQIYTALGDKDEAFQWFERGDEERDEDLALLKVDPRVDTLRDDPRFRSLLQRVGLANATNRQSLEAASGGRPG